MKSYYMIGSQDRESHRMYYYIGCDNGAYGFGSILSGRKFDTFEDVTEFIRDHEALLSGGFTLIQVADVTLEKAVSDKEAGDWTLWNNLHDPLYV